MTARPSRRWHATSVGCATALLLAACGGPNPSSTNAAGAMNVGFLDTTPPASGPLPQANWLMPKEPVSLDLSNDGASSSSDLIMTNVCERLNKLNPDRTLGPGLASKYEWRTPTSLVFTLRENVAFHDGAPMTADDVLWSMRRNSAEGAAEADEFVNVISIDKTGPHEIIFTLKQPDAVLLEALAGDAGVVQERKAVEAQGKSFGTPAGDDACSGPFMLQEWASGERIVIRKAPDYWDSAHAANTDEVTFKWASDDAIVNSLVTGAADGTYLENLAPATQLIQGANTTVTQGPDTRVWNMMITERGGLADPNIRKALSLALDRDGINRAAFAGLGKPWKEPVGPGAWGYQKAKFQAAYDQLSGSPAAPSPADIDTAKKMVAAAGTVGPIVIASDSTPIRNIMANGLVDAAQKIGLQASLIQIPNAQYGDYYADPDVRRRADVFFDDYFISKNDPVGFYKNGASDSAVQWVMKDPGYDTLVQRGRASLDDAQRADIAIELAKRWAEAKPWISVVQSPTTVAMSAKVTGVPSSGAFRYYPWAADLGAAGN